MNRVKVSILGPGPPAIFTSKYQGQQFVRKRTGGQIYYDSLVVTTKDVHRWGDFLIQIADKMGAASKVALQECVSKNYWVCDAERTKAIDALANIF